MHVECVLRRWGQRDGAASSKVGKVTPERKRHDMANRTEHPFIYIQRCLPVLCQSASIFISLVGWGAILGQGTFSWSSGGLIHSLRATERVSRVDCWCSRAQESTRMAYPTPTGCVPRCAVTTVSEAQRADRWTATPLGRPPRRTSVFVCLFQEG